MAMTHLRSGTLDRAIAVPVRDAEIGPAIRAPVRHRLGVRDFPCVDRAALSTMATAPPEHVLEPLGGRFLGREHVHQLNESDAFAVGFSGRFLGHFLSPSLRLDIGTQDDDFK